MCRYLSAAFGVAILLTPAPPAFAQAAYSGSVAFVRSNDDTARTEAVYVFNSIDWSGRVLRVGVTLPVIAQHTVWSADVADPLPDAGWQSGLGDPFVRGEVRLAGSRDGTVEAWVGGTVKLPVADVDRGLGSGKADVAFSATVVATRGRHSVLADLSYWRLGDPEGQVLQDTPAVYVGYAAVLDDAARWSAVVSVAASRAIVSGLTAPAQLGVTLLRGVGSNSGLGVTASVGLTAGAADLSIGASWRVGLPRR